MKIGMKNIVSNARGLTQAAKLGSIDALSTGSTASPTVFTRTYMASPTGDHLFVVGTGDLDPKMHTRLLIAYAASNNLELSALIGQWNEFLSMIGKDRSIIASLIARLAGTQARSSGVTNINSKAITSVTPSFVFTELMAIVPADIPTVLVHIMSDNICHQLKKLGWILPDAGYTYRLRRNNLYPRYVDLIDVMIAKDFMRTLQHLAAADISVVQKMVDSKRNLNPNLVVQQLQSAFVQASDLSRGSYDPKMVVDSVLVTLYKIWDPDLPRELAPRERVQNNDLIKSLRSNLAMFIATQDMMRQTVSSDQIIHYTDEEMTSTILPWFDEALGELSYYKLRMIDDVASFLGKTTSRDNRGAPGHIILYEDWVYASEMVAFTPVRHTREGKQRFLVVENNVSSALTTAIKPIQNLLTTKKMVDQVVMTYEMASVERRVPLGGAEVTLGFPSLIERQNDVGFDADLGIALRDGRAPEYDPEKSSVSQPLYERIFSELAYDYYAMLVHVAVSHTPSVAISAMSGAFDGSSSTGGSFNIPYLTWTIQTQLDTPVGDSAIMAGTVVTSEPLEAIAYADDFQPSKPLEHKGLYLKDYEDHLHIWDWHSSSTSLNFVATYQTEISGEQYQVSVTEHELLSLGARRDTVRYLSPSLSRAVAQMWMSWITEEALFIENELSALSKAGTKKSPGIGNTLIRDAFEGRRVQNGINVLNIITSIGASSFGDRAAEHIRRRVADQLYKAGDIDAQSSLYAGVQAHRIRTWAGLITLKMFDMISTRQETEIMNILRDTKAMQLVVGTRDLSAYPRD